MKNITRDNSDVNDFLVSLATIRDAVFAVQNNPLLANAGFRLRKLVYSRKEVPEVPSEYESTRSTF